MAWVTCPHCGFTQIPAASCLKCHERLDRPSDGSPVVSKPSPAPAPRQTAPSPPLRRSSLIAAAAAALALVIGAILWGARGGTPVEPAAQAPLPTPEPWTLDLTGRWQGRITTDLPGPPARPALRDVFIETDRSGNIVGAGVILTDPSHGGAAAGYQTVPNGRERLRTLAEATLASPKGVALDLDFIPFAAWAPKRERQWRVLEGGRRTVEETSYLLLESLEPDYQVQAGINASGFLSYVYLSPEYAGPRGVDQLSKIIHASSENTLRGFHNLIWDLSGSADFVHLQVGATVSQPAGSADRLTLSRS